MILLNEGTYQPLLSMFCQYPVDHLEEGSSLDLNTKSVTRDISDSIMILAFTHDNIIHSTLEALMIIHKSQDQVFLLLRIHQMSVRLIVPYYGLDIINIKVDCIDQHYSNDKGNTLRTYAKAYSSERIHAEVGTRKQDRPFFPKFPVYSLPGSVLIGT